VPSTGTPRGSVEATSDVEPGVFSAHGSQMRTTKKRMKVYVYRVSKSGERELLSIKGC
jgi:hypothetical protein